MIFTVKLHFVKHFCIVHTEQEVIMTQIIGFKLQEIVFYVGHGVGRINRMCEELISGYLHTFYVFQPTQKRVEIKVPIDNPRLLSIETFAGKNPLEQVRKVFAQEPGRASPLRGRWATKFQALERTIAATDNLHEVLTVVRDISRPLEGEHPITSIELQRTLKWWIAESIAAVLERTADDVLQEINEILNQNGKLAFPD